MNIFQDRLDEIENTNKNKGFKHTINKITRKGYQVISSTPFHFKKFEFNGNFHSTHIEEEKFTNFIKSYGENTYYKILNNIFEKLCKDDYDILEEFELEENNYSEISSETVRLKRIVMEVNNIKNERNLPKINELIPVRRLKEKEKRYKGMRLFVSISDNGYIDLYLIDLYHLGINAYNVNTGNYDLNRNYNTNKNNHKCISKVVDDYLEREKI